MSLVDGSLVISKTYYDEKGNLKVSNDKLVACTGTAGENCDYTLNPIDAADPTKGFTITLNKELTEGTQIKYQTKPNGVVSGESKNYKNEISTDKLPTTDEGTGKTTQGNIIKKNNGINYVNYTTKYTIDINNNNYPMYKAVFKDTMGKGQRVGEKPLATIPDSNDFTKLEVKNVDKNTTLTRYTDYKIINESIGADGKSYFEIEFMNAYETFSDHLQISYPVSIYPTELEPLDKYTNQGTLEFKVGTEPYNDTTNTNITPNDPSLNNGFKYGVYDYSNNKIT